jgi:hypothetical protein
MKLEAWVVGCTTGSRGEVPEERKHVIRGGNDDNNNTIPNVHVFQMF